MRKDITIAAEPRDSRGKNEARRLRAKGSMPAIVYGGPGWPTPVAVNPKELAKILNSKTGHNTIFNLAVPGGENTPVMIVDWQHDPDQGQSAARRSEAHRSDKAHPRQGSGGHARRSQGREAAGRTARNRHSRNRNRVPCRTKSPSSSMSTSAELHDRPKHSRLRYSADRFDEAVQPGRYGDLARGLAEGGGRTSAELKQLPVAAEPEVDQEGQEGRSRRRGQEEVIFM